MVSTTTNDLATRVREFVAQTGSCLFAGAGVGQKAGLPSWNEYLEHLASVASKHEKETSALMRKRMKSGLYFDAAELYKKCPEIPKGIKYKELATPFLNYSANELHALMALPFSAVVTTNYDRAIHDAYFNLFNNQENSGLNLTSPKYVELGDASIKQAPYWRDFYIARIHGRAEIPDTMVLTDEDYLKIQKDPSYQDFIVHVFKNYKCLFIGFSFLDPAIKRILNLMEETLAQPYPSLHLALIPADSDFLLTSKLAKFNIQVAKYDPTNKHEALWNAIKDAQRDIRKRPREAPDKVEPISGLHRFLASCYARMKLGKKAEPLREIVVQGMVAQTIIESGLEGITKKDLIQHLKNYISLDDTKLDTLITRSIQGLTAQSVCEQTQDRFTCNLEGHKSYDKVITKLGTGVLHRLKVREGVQADKSLRGAITEVLNRIFLTRGWDLGAHFAGGHPFSTFDDRFQVQNLLKKFSKDISPNRFESIANSILALFKYPDDKEAVLLADVGRIAFGVELILSNARSTTEQSLIFPDILYLDASVVMPSIVDGHPYGPIYCDAVTRMQFVGKQTGVGVEAQTASIFLEEILHHRSSSIKEVHDQHLENPDKLKTYIYLFGAENTNVFIGSYASWVGREKKKISYSKFLQQTAPYNTEEALEIFLKELGIRKVDIVFRSNREKSLFHEIRNSLQNAYDKFEYHSSFYRKKAEILIDHEAKQLTQLIIDTNTGKNPLFVTADKRLMSMLNGETLGLCAKNVISHLGLIQLVDLVIGLEKNADKRSLARLMWSVEFSDEKTSIHNYLIDLALQYVDDAKTMAMWEIVDGFTENGLKKAEQEGITMSMRLGSRTDRARIAKFLDRLEQDFYKKMDEVIRSRERE